MASGSSSKDNTKVKKYEINLSEEKKKNKVVKLIEDFDHEEFLLSQGWICFAFGKDDGEVRTNHATLKFDFKSRPNQLWHGFTLEAEIDPNQSKGPESEVNLSLRSWKGKPWYKLYCIEIKTDFDRATGSTTLGNFIQILSRRGLLRFSYSADNVDDAYVGCRDYVTQVLFALAAESRIFKRPVKGGSGSIGTLDQNGALTSHGGPGPLFPDIFAALAVYYEEIRDEDRRSHLVVSSSKVEKGDFPDWKGTKIMRITTRDGHPYEVPFQLGTRSDRAFRPPVPNPAGPTGQGGGFGGGSGGGLQGALGGPPSGYVPGYGGQGGGYGGQVGGYGGQVGGYGGQGGGYGGQGGGYGPGYYGASGPGYYGGSGSSSGGGSMHGSSRHHRRRR